ncbi:hypothetical protein B0H14DRAFT_3668453 [Mycena olivaceomarginata]|nr:hypothetical protein B0H14DRAFT_3668453 [Mycena olivaceomarginata]
MSLFGQLQAQQQTSKRPWRRHHSSASSNNLLPNTSQQAPSLFGGAANTLFDTAKPAGGLAGAPKLTSLNTGGSSLFGGEGSTNALGTQPTQSIFGQPAPAPGMQQNQQQRPGLFGGALSSSNIFGASAPNANGALKSAPPFGCSFGLGLGGQKQQQQPNNAFGASTLSTSALRPAGATQPGKGQGQGQAADVQTQFTRPTPRIERNAAAWNAAGPGCHFQTTSSTSPSPRLLFFYPPSPFLPPSLLPPSPSPSVLPLPLPCFVIFYNHVDPVQVGLYGRPPNATNGALWARAVRENPDPGWAEEGGRLGMMGVRRAGRGTGASTGGLGRARCEREGRRECERFAPSRTRALACVSHIYDGVALPFCGGSKSRGFFPSLLFALSLPRSLAPSLPPFIPSSPSLALLPSLPSPPFFSSFLAPLLILTQCTAQHRPRDRSGHGDLRQQSRARDGCALTVCCERRRERETPRLERGRPPALTGERAFARRAGESVDDTTTSKVACPVEPVFHLIEVQSCAIPRFVSFRFAATQDEDNSRIDCWRSRATCTCSCPRCARRASAAKRNCAGGWRSYGSRWACAGMEGGRCAGSWASCGRLSARWGRHGGRRAERGGGGEWKVVDEDGLARIAQIPSEQQGDLVHLTKILRGDLADIHVVLNGGGRQGEEGDSEELWGSQLRR